MEISAIRGKGGGRLMTNAIKNFQIFFEDFLQKAVFFLFFKITSSWSR